MIELEQMPAHSRVWIYQSDRNFKEEERQTIDSALDAFVSGWTAHSKQLFATAFLAFDRYVIFLVDEKSEAASGCSIDKSVKMVQELEVRVSCTFFDRLNFTYQTEEGIQTIHKDDMQAAYRDGIINDKTLFFNNLVTSKEGLMNDWRVELENSWHKQFV